MAQTLSDRDRLKQASALRAIEYVKDGMVVGLGTGSTAYFVVEGLGARVAQGLKIVGIPTSERTATQALEQATARGRYSLAGSIRERLKEMQRKN